MATTIDLEAVAAEVLAPLEGWAAQCHGASVRLVRSGRLGECRVARGSCDGVFSQHSWVVMGNDCYDDDATIVDPTLWSYRADIEGVWIGTYGEGWHQPHGKGSIWAWGRPEPASGEPFELRPREPWSSGAEAFLDTLGPLDRDGWAVLATHAPVEGWPAGEIFDAMIESGLEVVIPIDRVGMLTDRNPSGLYLPGGDD